MQLFARTQQFQASWDEATGELRVRVAMHDAYHDMGVEVWFTYPELTMRAIEPWARRTPYPICPQAIERLQRCVGLQVGQGVTFRIQRQLGGREGCSHLTRLLTDACHTAVQGLLARKSLEEGRQGPQPSDSKVAFLEGHGLAIRNSCLAYDLDRDRAEGPAAEEDS